MTVRLRRACWTLLLWTGCGTTIGGGGGGTFCGVGGACPVGYVCNPQNYCIIGVGDVSGADGAIGADILADGAGPDDAANADVFLDGTPADTGAEDAAAGDATVTDVPKPDAGKPDAGKPDTGPSDVPATDTGPATTTVAALQKSAASTSCAAPDASVASQSGVLLEPVVATSPSATLKGTSGYFTSFFAAPQKGGASDGTWGGVQVIVLADPFAVSVGDVLQLSGTVQEFYCMTEVIASGSNAVIVGHEADPLPHLVQMAQLDASSAEAFEGDLLKISSVQVVDPNPVGADGKTHGEATISHAGGSVQIALAPALGSSHLTSGSNGVQTTFAVGTNFMSVTGNLQWSFGHWVLRARSDVDLVVK